MRIKLLPCHRVISACPCLPSLSHIPSTWWATCLSRLCTLYHNDVRISTAGVDLSWVRLFRCTDWTIWGRLYDVRTVQTATYHTEYICCDYATSYIQFADIFFTFLQTPFCFSPISVSFYDTKSDIIFFTQFFPTQHSPEYKLMYSEQLILNLSEPENNERSKCVSSQSLLWSDCSTGICV